MRFRRAFLVGLAPLLSLSAFVSAVGSAPNETHSPSRNSLASLLLTVVHLVSPEAHAQPVSATPKYSSPQSYFTFSALALTPLGHSLWLVARGTAAPVFLRRPQHSLLRC